MTKRYNFKGLKIFLQKFLLLPHAHLQLFLYHEIPFSLTFYHFLMVT